MLVLVLTAGLLVQGSLCAMTASPLIGILTQPTGSSLSHFGKSYIAASYVKYVESGGARAVPIPYDGSEEEIRSLFSSVNGILFPGGGADLGPDTAIFKTASLLLDLAIQSGDVPVVGHCMGFELISLIVSNKSDLLKPFDAENITLPLDFTIDPYTSKLFRHAPIEVVDALSSAPITMNNHMYGVTPGDYAANPRLAQFFKVVSTNNDRAGKTFVSTVEAYNYPIWALQWHPEKNQFEWYKSEVINHGPVAIDVMQYMAQFFVDQSRANNHAFSSPQDAKNAMIYNTKPTFTANLEPDFEQCYFF